jgi:hypothetical protein
MSPARTISVMYAPSFMPSAITPAASAGRLIALLVISASASYQNTIWTSAGTPRNSPT